MILMSFYEAPLATDCSKALYDPYMTTTFDNFTILFASRPVCLLLLLLPVCAAGGRNYKFDWTTVSTSTSDCYSNAALQQFPVFSHVSAHLWQQSEPGHASVNLVC